MKTNRQQSSPRERARLKAAVRGAVQGVGFRPFVFRVATELGLSGWVHNSPQGVFIEAEGKRGRILEFLLRLDTDLPPRSFIQSLETSWLEPAGYAGFEIRESARVGTVSAVVLPDCATCPDCLGEILDPSNRRFGYPFTNCTHCGPRYSIIEALPYDRPNTSMKRFKMCPACQAEYEDPLDRRFHAQPNACPACGPQLEFWNRDGEPLFGGNDALLAAARAIGCGQIVAVKGMGGFHLFADATNEVVVRALRERKHREEKPLALMFPSLSQVAEVCDVSPREARFLQSAEAPIVLLARRPDMGSPSKLSIAESVAPGNPCFGVMLPYTPLHYLLMRLVRSPVVATSGNLTDEPICIDEYEALTRLDGVADLFLVHDRPIVRSVDDSVARVMLDREQVLRRARGYAPLPIDLPAMGDCQRPILALGAHLKNTVALAVGPQVFLSQHIGDLETDEAHKAFHNVIGDLQHLYAATPSCVAADLHPDYLSTKLAKDLCTGQSTSDRISNDGRANHIGSGRVPRHVEVQHHVAHVLSCIAENEVELPALGIAWDGTGYGTDGTVWGGEFFLITDSDCRRVAHLRTFRLPGGERAVREPRRSALGLLYEVFKEKTFAMDSLPPLREMTLRERSALNTMLKRNVNSPRTSSMGRLFDAIAALAGLRQKTGFEGQAAMELEFASDSRITDGYPFPVPQPVLFSVNPDVTMRSPLKPVSLDWEPMLRAILDDVNCGVSTATIAARFHNALAEMIVQVARRAGLERIVLSGGCFQNRLLTELAVRRLLAEGFRPAWHQRVPPNDGGIALGQVIAAKRVVNQE